MNSLHNATATRYLQPLREGGSLPAVIEAEDGDLWVTKFRGAGQGPKSLIAELIVGLLAQHLDLPVPDLAIVDLPAGFGDDQPDPEIRDLLQASVGANVGLRYMDGAFNFDGLAAGHLIDPDFAADVVWLDATVTNPDRTPRNPNLMVWQRQPWLIDHGSALYAHHAWSSVDSARTRTPFKPISQHIFLEQAGDLRAADRRNSERLDTVVFAALLNQVPESLLMDPLAAGDFASADQSRQRYVSYLADRLDGREAFVEEAVRAQQEARNNPKQRLETRR